MTFDLLFCIYIGRSGVQAQKVNVDTATHVHGQTCEPSEDNNTREWQQKENGQLLTSTNSLLDSLVV